MIRIRGGVAQLGEHLLRKQGVKSSNLSISTRYQEMYLYISVDTSHVP